MGVLHGFPSLVAGGRARAVPAGGVVFEVGDPVDAMHIVVNGVVFVRSSSLDGDLAVVDVRARGDVLDDTALLDDQSRLHYDGATALTDLGLLQLPRRSFDQLRDESAEIGAALIEQMTDQVRRLSAALVDLLGRPGLARAARRLLALADAQVRSGVVGQPLVVTQQDLADYAGTTRSTLNAYLREFEKASALETARGRITITDPRALDRFV